MNRERLKDEIAILCSKDENGQVLKSRVNVKNFKRLKELIKYLDIEVIKSGGKFSYRQYCKLFDSYLFKKQKCGGKICCQAITEEGQRCSRPASKFTTIDLTEIQILPSIPTPVKKALGVKKLEELKLIGFANTCCFYCWQHAAMYTGEKLTWIENFTYYITHPEDLLSIFFEEVKAKKVLGIITYKLDWKNLRPPDEIVKFIYKTSGVMSGALTTYYWGVFIAVFMYDSIKPHLLRILTGTTSEKNDIIDDMAVTAAETLLYINE